MTGTTGALASATVAIRLLRLRGAAAAHCLSIAATQASGHREQFGTMTKPFHAGHAATSGVWAGLLAEKGFTAAPDPLEGRRGIFAVMTPASRPEVLTDRLGDRWQIIDNGVKPYACGVVIHPAVDAVRALSVREGLVPEQIESIELRVHPLVGELTGKVDPRTGLEGEFSVTFACAIALLEGVAGEAQFSGRMFAVRTSARSCPGSMSCRTRKCRTPRPGLRRRQSTARPSELGSTPPGERPATA